MPSLSRGLVDVHRDHLAQHQPGGYRLAVGTLQLHDLRAAALKTDGALLYRGARIRREGGVRPASTNSSVSGSRWRWSGSWPRPGLRRQAPAKFTRRLDVAQRPGLMLAKPMMGGT